MLRLKDSVMLCEKEEVALQMARESGIESVVARELGKRPGTCSSPVFTESKNMEELYTELRKLALREFEAYVLGLWKKSMDMQGKLSIQMII